jgi:hypothetical protein
MNSDTQTGKIVKKYLNDESDPLWKRGNPGM